MRWSSAWLSVAMTAGLALCLVGCGGGESADETEEAAAADPAPPAEAAPPAPGPAADLAEVPAKPAAAPTEPVSEPAAPAPRAAATSNSAATDELLQLAQSSAPEAPAAAPGSPEAAPGAPGEPPRMAGAFQIGPPPGSGPGGIAPAAPVGLAAPGIEPAGEIPGAATIPPPTEGFGASAPGDTAIPGAEAIGADGANSALADYKGPDFSDPLKGAKTFLAAVKAKNREQLAAAVALRSGTEATAKHQPLFKSILDQSVEDEKLDELATLFDKMEMGGLGSLRAAGMYAVPLRRVDDEGRLVTIVLEVRHEKAGWKVRDFENPRVGQTPSTVRRKPFGVKKGR